MKTLLLLDTSFKSAYCSFKRNDPGRILETEKIRIFSEIMEKIEHKFKGFEGDYPALDHNVAIIEYCRLGQLLNTTIGKWPTEFEKCFVNDETIDLLFDQHKDSEQLRESLYEHFNQALENLYEYFMERISISELVENAAWKLEQYRCHENVVGIERSINIWIKNITEYGKKSNEFVRLCLMLAWHSLTQRDYKNKSVYHLLMGFYLASRTLTDLPGSILFGKLIEKNFFRQNEELLDALILEYVFMGYPSKTGKRIRVIAVTTDKRLKNNIDDLIESAISIKSRIKGDPPLQARDFTFVPGILIICGNDVKEEVVVIDIEQRIKDKQTIL